MSASAVTTKQANEQVTAEYKMFDALAATTAVIVILYFGFKLFNSNSDWQRVIGGILLLVLFYDLIASSKTVSNYIALMQQGYADVAKAQQQQQLGGS